LKLAACQRFDPDKAPSDWTVEPIKNRLRLEYGSGLTEVNRNEGDYPVYGSNGQVGTHDKYLVEGPGILVGRKGSVGEVHFSENSFWPIDTVYYVRRLKEDNWRFLYYLLTYLNLGQLNAATGVPGLTRRDAHFILGAFPPPNEEDEIANIIKLAEEAIAAAGAKLTAARRLKTALMQQLFTRGIPGRHTRFQKTKVGEIPAEWELKTLSAHCGGPDCVRTGPFGAQLPEEAFAKTGIRMVNITDIGEGELDLTSDFYVRPEVFDRLQDYSLVEGDVVFSRVASVGRLGLIHKEHEPLLMSSNCIRLRPGMAFNAKFLTHVFLDAESVARQVEAMSNAGARPIVTPRFLRRMLIPRPPRNEQDEIASFIEAADENMRGVRSEITTLERLKRSLLQNLLSGRVRIRVES
jgi:type I restriction enzyme S subunit